MIEAPRYNCMLSRLFCVISTFSLNDIYGQRPLIVYAFISITSIYLYDSLSFEGQRKNFKICSLEQKCSDPTGARGSNEILRHYSYASH